MNQKHVLDKAYNPKQVEEKWSQFWIDEGLFTAEASSKKKKFSMVLPPPNVTGSLHMGHALCFTLPDVLVRWKRMQGYNVLWLPGTDHASIAVHNVIEKRIAQKGLSRERIGREEFLKMAWEWKEKYGGVIINQLKKLGFSLDWTRERFTMDDGFSYAVNRVFVDLYREGLIYRDYYMVNRCPHCGTVLSDIEIEHKEMKSQLYYIKYPLVDSQNHVVVATTRPETMLGDTAVAVHPDDERYTRIHGQKLILPVTGRKIPVITDERVEREFGTGVVKVTPSHDPVDFELGKKHNLEQVTVIDGSGKMTEEAGEEFRGLDRFEGRQKIVRELKKQGFLEKVEDYQHAVGHCYRCKTAIEPHLSWQWFVKTKPLAQEAIRVVEEGKIKFVPSNWAKIYFDWMYNIYDWCISRQLWWGHRIPAWYCQDCGKMMVALKAPQKCDQCESSHLVQDEDVLDTWFSSALWPFATLGWPGKTEDLETFYPTDLMSTGFDIIFFWVARMIMMGLKFMGEIPFKEVYINGLVRDFKKRKMSKSEGNIIDPLEMVKKYGTDALRFTLVALAAPGMDISLSEERMVGYRAFVNKVWNASRFVLMNLEEGELKVEEEELTLADRWIQSRLNHIIKETNQALQQYRMYEAAEKIYHFVWHEFCDWYVEMVKPSLKQRSWTSLSVLVESLDQILRLLHPFMPFVTEEIWQHLPYSGKSLAVASFPQSRKGKEDPRVEREMKLLQDVITEVRTIRAENRIHPHKRVPLWIKVKEKGHEESLLHHQVYIIALANIRELKIKEDFPQEKKLLRGVTPAYELAVPVEEGMIDFEKEKQRLRKELAKVQEEMDKIKVRLQDDSFLQKAPKNVIEETQKRMDSLKDQKEKLRKNLDQLLSSHERREGR
ncbi:valine--tRNA ligase [bacterium]|nr:valine--tRNA ligase [bacterium]